MRPNINNLNETNIFSASRQLTSVMHNEQYECASLLRIFKKKKKNDIGTYYLNIHFSLCYVRAGKQILNN